MDKSVEVNIKTHVQSEQGTFSDHTFDIGPGKHRGLLRDDIICVAVISSRFKLQRVDSTFSFTAETIPMYE